MSGDSLHAGEIESNYYRNPVILLKCPYTDSLTPRHSPRLGQRETGLGGAGDRERDQVMWLQGESWR